MSPCWGFCHTSSGRRFRDAGSTLTAFLFPLFGGEQGGRIYETWFGIRAWKDKMPDMSRVMKDMLPKRLPQGAGEQDIGALVAETCVAELVHVVLCLFAPGIYTFWDNRNGVLLTLFYIFCNIPFILIQRYVRPQLTVLADRDAGTGGPPPCR